MRVSRIDEFICKQEKLKKLNRASIEAMQLSKLNAVLKREKERAAYYKDLPDSLSSLDELSMLPFTKAEDLYEHGFEMLLCSQSEIQRIITDKTSGTSGQNKRVFYTGTDCENTVELFVAGLGELIFPGSVTMICMPFSGPFGLGELISEAVERLRARPLKLGVGLSYGELREIMAKEQPDSYVGMPAPLLSMLRYCGKGSLKRALVSGDACSETVIAQCELSLGSRLFPHYGSREMALGGAICCQAHEGMHLRENHVIPEIIDKAGNPLPRGQWGELVITTIGMEAQPLIRYRTGDYTRIFPEECPCGSAVLRIDRVERVGEIGSMSRLDEKIFGIPSIVDYKAWTEGSALNIEAVSTAKVPEGEILKVCPEISGVSVRLAKDEDKAMYFAKRRIEQH